MHIVENSGMFQNLAFGDVFKFAECPKNTFMKVKPVHLSVPVAVNLENGHTAFVKDSDPVIYYPKATLKLQGDQIS